MLICYAVQKGETHFTVAVVRIAITAIQAVTAIITVMLRPLRTFYTYLIPAIASGIPGIFFAAFLTEAALDALFDNTE